MESLFSISVIPSRGGYPWVAVLLLATVLLYELVSGNLVGLRWQAWVTRRAHPRKYWTVLTIEALIVLVYLYMGVLSEP